MPVSYENRSDYYKKYYQTHKEKAKEYYQKNKEKRIIYQKNNRPLYMAKIRNEVFSHYTNGLMKCSCGYSDIRALTIDHINGGGTKERMKEKAAGAQFYAKLKKRGYPEGYQVLCMNCQFIKRWENNEV